MKVTVINGNMRHGSTWHLVQEVLENLKKREKVEVAEFFLPKDLPSFCNGCFSCIYHGEETCPHKEYVSPIVSALTTADLIILASPVYGFDVTGQMKAFIDHLCFMWMSHRPAASMFDKVGLTVTTSAGAGLSHTTKTMKNSLVFWGVKNIYSFKFPVSAMKWEDVSEKNKLKIERNAGKLATQISRAVKNTAKSPNPIFRSFFFKLMAGMQKKNDWNLTDRNHWQAMGWLSGSKPF
jgi:multimeric flavodoxin WrbA